MLTKKTENIDKIDSNDCWTNTKIPKPCYEVKYVSSSYLTTQTFYLLPSISLDAASPLECIDLVGQSKWYYYKIHL